MSLSPAAQRDIVKVVLMTSSPAEVAAESMECNVRDDTEQRHRKEATRLTRPSSTTSLNERRKTVGVESVSGSALADAGNATNWPNMHRSVLGVAAI